MSAELTYKSTIVNLQLMDQSTISVSAMLDSLTLAARRQGLNDSAWAARAGLRKETLSRVRGRGSADFATLACLAHAIGAQIQVHHAHATTLTDDGHFPARVDRDYEQQLLELAADHALNPAHWRSVGPRFFMSGLAVMLASVRGMPRHRLLAMAEDLHPGSSQPQVFSLWLARTAIQPSRFIPMLRERLTRAA